MTILHVLRTTLQAQHAVFTYNYTIKQKYLKIAWNKISYYEMQERIWFTSTQQLTYLRLVGWLFNGTSTQKGQYVPTVGVGNWLSWLRIANEYRRYSAYYLTLHDNNVTQFTVKHSSYISATTGYLIE